MPCFDRDDLAGDPVSQFGGWWERAADVPLREAVTLATVDESGAPDARMVLLKGFGEDGFRFFSNYESAKAAQLKATDRAALVVYWRELDRQVRIRGTVEMLSPEDSDEYFASRPRESQLGAWASPQSQPLPDRAELDTRLREAEKGFDGVDVERPGFWGGYVVRHEVVEFWQGQVGRLHDRFTYTRDGAAWKIERLGP